MLNTFSVIVKIISDENCFPSLKAENFPRFSKIPTFRLKSFHIISYRGSESKWGFAGVYPCGRHGAAKEFIFAFSHLESVCYFLLNKSCSTD